MADVAFLFASVLARNVEAEGISGSTPLAERARACFQESRTDRSGFMLSTDDLRFRAAVGALILLSSEEERARITREMRLLASVSAASNGVPVDFGALLDGEHPEPIGLLGLYRETSQK